jgi:aspartate kinase
VRILVQKYGGSSLATPHKVRGVAQRVLDARRRGYAVVAVVSAMGDTTDDLLELARGVSEEPDPRELDVLLASGETVSTALLAMALRDLGQPALSLSGGACGIVTNDVHGNARIVAIHPQRVRAVLAEGAVAVAAGFQGVGPRGHVTTLGRGGSDTSAVALAAALRAERCEIYTDVDGVFSADPRVVPGARQIESLGSDELEELAWHGAQVVKAEAVEFGADNGVAVLVASTFGEGHGTLVHPSPDEDETFRPRRAEVAGVSGRKDLLRVRVHVEAPAARRAELFAALARYDLVFGGLGAPGEGDELFVSTLEMPDPRHVEAELTARFADVAAFELGLGAVSLVGFGLGSRPQALFDAAARLRGLGARVRRGFTARESLAFVLPVEDVDACVRALHRDWVEAPEAELEQRLCT